MPPLTDINLARNAITCTGAVALAEFLVLNYHMRTVNLSWNKIKGKGGIVLAEAIREAQRIVFFDGSFNLFGFKHNGDFGRKMGEACNKGILRHLDISYNSLDKNECKAFGDAIHDNHTLWGLHMMGNDCFVDSGGFV